MSAKRGIVPRLAFWLVLGWLGAFSLTAQEGKPVNHSKALSEETAPALLAKINASDAEWLAKRVLQRLHVLEAQGNDPEFALDEALRRNRMPIARREAMERTFVPMYTQAKKLGLFAPVQKDWWKVGSAAEPRLKRILPVDEYPQYAGELVNFTLAAEISEADRAKYLKGLQALPPPGETIQSVEAAVSAPMAPAPVEVVPPVAATVPAPNSIYVTNPQDHEVAGESLSAEPMNSGSTGIYSDYIPGTSYYYPPYYGGGYYPPGTRPPDYDRPPRPPRPRPRTRTSTGAVDVPVPAGIPKTTSSSRRQRIPVFDPSTMTRDEFQERYGVRP